jgi:hypothetical protein
MRIAIEITSTSPLLVNKFTDAAAQAATSGMRGSSGGADRGTPREIAESKLYLDSDGKFCIPQPNLLRCIVDGGSFHKIGKKQVTTKESSLVYACANIVGLSIPIEHKQPWSVDIRPVVIPATKGRILCPRPRFDDWALSFELVLMTDIIGPGLMRRIIDDAGTKIGLGDFRPARKGPFGRFNVTSWQEIVPEALKEAAE